MRGIQLFLLILLVFNTVSHAQTATELFKEGLELRKEGKDKKALKKFEDALIKARANNNRSLQMSCHLELAELKDNVINYKEALDHYKSFSELYKLQMQAENELLVDSVSTLESDIVVHKEQIEQKSKAIDSLTTEQLQSQLNIQNLELANQKQQLELRESENRRNKLIFAIGTVLLILIFFGLGYARKRRVNKTLRNKNYQIAKEKEKSEALLLNILPKVVADELKEFGKTSSLHYESATVMFTDFKGFTKFSEQHSPEKIVTIIDQYFRAFDDIIEKYDIEKIKTIGDAYMCVAGIPESQPDHVQIMIQAAFEMQAYVREQMHALKASDQPYLQMRIGIHTGPLVAGVVGSRKFAYDVWGDSVNIAARMEQSSEPGSINVSESVYEAVKEDFQFEFRGEVEAKNKGLMKMYFVRPA